MLKIELHNIVELVLSGGYEYRTSPCAVSGERPVELHDPSVRCLPPWGEQSILASLEAWRLCPFRHDVRKRSPFDDSGCAEFYLKHLQLDVPFSDSSNLVGAPEHPFQGVC